jgi:beta-glucosidase
MAEFEEKNDAILVHFGVSDQAVLDIVTGEFEPSGLLPFQMPATMRTVDEQFEDTPRDMEPYTDSDGNTYDFAFGLNWQGVIDDERVEKYR